jgi:hypothetical protein
MKRPPRFGMPHALPPRRSPAIAPKELPRATQTPHAPAVDPNFHPRPDMAALLMIQTTAVVADGTPDAVQPPTSLLTRLDAVSQGLSVNLFCSRSHR